MFRTQGGGANRRRPISAAARRGNPPEFTNLGAPGHYSSEAKVWEGLHIMRDPPEATPRHKEVRSEEGKGGGGAGPWRVSPARTAMAVRGQIGLVAGLVSKSSATRTRLSIREGAWETWHGVQRCRVVLRGRGSPAYLFRA